MRGIRWECIPILNKYSLIYQSEDAFEADFHQLQDYLYEVTGEKSRYYRFPAGAAIRSAMCR
ncbi:MAG: hypothetical protein ACLR78_14645 [Roseburia sp.]